MMQYEILSMLVPRRRMDTLLPLCVVDLCGRKKKMIGGSAQICWPNKWSILYGPVRGRGVECRRHGTAVEIGDCPNDQRIPQCSIIRVCFSFHCGRTPT